MFLLMVGVAVLVMFGALLLIPLGLPGTWIMIGVLAIATFAGEISAGMLIACMVIAGIAELV
jgi:hypothetical protein